MAGTTEKIMFILEKKHRLGFCVSQISNKILIFSPERKTSNYNLTEMGYEQEFVWMARLFWS